MTGQAVRCGMESLYMEQNGQEEEDWKREEEIHALHQALRRELMMEWGGEGGRLDLSRWRV